MWGHRQILLASAVLAAVAVGACAADREGGRADATSTTPTTVPEDPCADRECTLGEAAARVGITFGVHLEVVDDPAVALATSEFALLTNHAVSLSVIEPSPGEWNFEPADEMAALAEDHELASHGFHWLWSQPTLDMNPDWVETIDDRDELWAAVEEHLAVVADRYPGLDRINVVNEPLDGTTGEVLHNLYYDVLGPDYVAEAFTRAKDIAPDIELFINENTIEYNAEKAESLLALVTDLVDRGVPIDGVGFQTHLFVGDPDWDLMARTMRAYSDLGLKVAITELDAPMPPDQPDREAVQAERMARVVQLCVDTPSCDQVIVWGVHDEASWLDNFMGPGFDPLLFDAELEPKPAYEGVRDVLLDAQPRG